VLQLRPIRLDVEKSAATETRNWPSEIRELRKWSGQSQIKMAALFGVSPATWRLWEWGRRAPSGDNRVRLETALAGIKAAPKRQVKTHRFPFGLEAIPTCCGQQAQYTKKFYSRAQTRRKWLWEFFCRKCGSRFLRDKLGMDVPPLRSGNTIELPFRRPKCCGREMIIVRRQKHSQFPGQVIFNMVCYRKRTCPHKRGPRKFVADADGFAREVTKEFRPVVGPRLSLGVRPACRICKRPFAVFYQRRIGGAEQVNFGCARHGGKRWYQKVKGNWTPVLAYKRGPHPFNSSQSQTLPRELEDSVRPKCQNPTCSRKGKVLRLHEYPPTRRGHRYKLYCPECRKGTQWLDGKLRRLPAPGRGRPKGTAQMAKRILTHRKKDLVVRERNKLIFEAKSKGTPTRKICENLDARGIHPPKKWRKEIAVQSWTESYSKDPRPAVRLFSVIYHNLRKLSARELAYYFY